MSWDPTKYRTQQELAQLIQNCCQEMMRGDDTDPINGYIYLPYWWVHKELRVFWSKDVPMPTVLCIVNAVAERIQETIGLEFTFNLLEDHESAMTQIRQATVRGQVDENKLFNLALSESWRDEEIGGHQHGDIYITTKPLLNDLASWGAASFGHGAIIFALHGQRYLNEQFLRKVALHETNHLLGMPLHCDDFRNIEGFTYTPHCNAHYSCAGAKLCPKCHFFIHHWWMTIQQTS